MCRWGANIARYGMGDMDGLPDRHVPQIKGSQFGDRILSTSCGVAKRSGLVNCGDDFVSLDKGGSEEEIIVPSVSSTSFGVPPSTVRELNS